MRKLLFIGLVFAGACRSHTVEVPVRAPAPVSAPTSSAAGAASPRQAIESFLGAVRAQDLQAMSLIWGNKDGPVRDSKVFSREEMEQRELILMRCLRHDRYRVLGDAPAADNERVVQVELTRGTIVKQTDFYITKGGSRWYVRSANMDPLKDLCSAK